MKTIAGFFIGVILLGWALSVSLRIIPANFFSLMAALFVATIGFMLLQSVNQGE
jgi:hypothetical protein